VLRVGLTGGLGSGKSTAARIFAGLGAYVLSSDTIGRELMEPGQAVFNAIAAHFGREVVDANGRLNRAALAKIAFEEGRVEELNAIVHPAVIRRQAELSEEIRAKDPGAVVMVESALILETKYGEEGLAGTQWGRRFDRLILVTAPEEMKIARFVARSIAGGTVSAERRAELEDEARRRIAQQIPDEQKSAMCDYVLTNGGSLKELEWQVDQLWPLLKQAAIQSL
jgi:dephospho-CoA kinase